MKLRPFTGKFATEISLTVELICDRVVSTDGVVALIGPRTVTDSVMFPGASSIRSAAVWPIDS
jgi:hypothetical protein